MMKAIMFAVASIFVVTASATESVARPYFPNATGFQTGAREHSPLPRDAHRRGASRSYGATSARRGVGPRPSRWCGWWMRTQKGGGSELNLARNWKNWGRPTGPRVGAVVVWNHHV